MRSPDRCTRAPPPLRPSRRCVQRARKLRALLCSEVLWASPLWQRARKGCARAHEGKVFVEKREWTRARCEVYCADWRSTK